MADMKLRVAIDASAVGEALALVQALNVQIDQALAGLEKLSPAPLEVRIESAPEVRGEGG